MGNLFLLLPAEIKEDILDHLVQPIRATRDFSSELSDLARLACADREWHARCLPHLYAQIRLPRTHTPPGSEKHLLHAARDTSAILLARTLRHNESLAHLVKDIEIVPSWLPEDGMERAREAYIDVLNCATQVISIAFFVSRGEYNEVLPSIKTLHPNLTTLIIGVDHYSRDLFFPLLAKQRAATFDLGGNASPRPLSSRTDPGPTPQIRLRSFYLAPALRELQVYLPSRLELDFTVASTIRVALPPHVQQLDLFVGLLLSDHGVWSRSTGGPNTENALSMIATPLPSFFGPYLLGKAEAVLKLATTVFLEAPAPDPQSSASTHDEVQNSTDTSSAPPPSSRIEHRLETLRVHFADRRTRGSSARLRAVLDMLRSSAELQPFFPRALSDDGEAEREETQTTSSVQVEITSFPLASTDAPHINDRGYSRRVEDATLFRLALADPEREARLARALRLRSRNGDEGPAP